jgi:hypothetical protein
MKEEDERRMKTRGKEDEKQNENRKKMKTRSAL